MTTRKKRKISTEPNKKSNFVQLLKKRRTNHRSKKNRQSSKKRHTSKKMHSSKKKKHFSKKKKHSSKKKTTNVIKKERMRRIPRRRSLTGVTHVETMLIDHIRSLVPKALELDGYLDENKDPNVKIHEKEENVQKKEVAIKGNQDSNGESKEKKKNKAKKKSKVKKKSKCILDKKKKMKSKGNMGDTCDTTINVEKKCKKNVKHDPVINSKQKCKEKEKENKKITSRCKGNGKSNIPAITKERSSRPNNNQVTDQSKAEEIQIEKETNSETLCLPSKRRVRLKTEISNDKSFCLIIDEATDRLSRPLVALLAATSTDTWVLELDEIQEMTATNMELFIRKSLEYYEIPFKKITALVSDGAPVCCKLGKTLTKVCEIKHIICACHTLHLISAKLIDSFDLANLVLHNKDKLKQFIQLEERSKTSNILIEHLSSKIFLEELVFIEYIASFILPLIQGLQAHCISNQTIKNWINFKNLFFQLEYKNFYNFVPEKPQFRETKDKIKFFFTRIQQYETRINLADDVIKMYYWFSPENILPNIRKEDLPIPEILEYINGSILGEWLRFQHYLKTLETIQTQSPIHFLVKYEKYFSMLK
ncbi:chromodomain-helicase-DNA-binding protein 3-related-related [Anaeramoeba flamelloides]|uniref:Chromodomain-helicase-DNA-binding protein 3-related-related n=1 Tax=Anaeramoeba flamelloides TaxID=1746091 RepID=A0AAV7Y5D5_9EUKA|nr:chromodomain-helicase-DNA-binding protein 3-related-related [Anaeramoeba flamelloides]